MQSSTLRSQAASLPVLRQRARSSRLHFYKARSQVCRSRGPAQPAAQASRDELQASQQPKVLEKIRHMLTGTASRVFAACAVAALLVMSTPGMAEAARSGGRVGGSGGFSSARSGGMSSGPAFGGRSGGGYGHSAPQMRSSTHLHVGPSVGYFGYGPAPMVYGGVGGGSSLFTFLILGIFAYVLFNTFVASNGEDEYDVEEGREPMSVVKVQVGLLGTARELQRDLNRMANNLDTSTSQGLHYLLQETVLALQRNPQYAVYGKSELQKTRGLDNAENKFNNESMKERGKFERETLSNYGGNRNRAMHRASGNGGNELIVVTVIAAIDGKLEPAQVNDLQGLKENLSLLGSVPADRLLALEVLWTPQDENDYFTKDELVTDYPTLNML